MAKQRIKIKTRTRTITTRKVRNSQITIDRKGRTHCIACGAYIGTKGKKK